MFRTKFAETIFNNKYKHEGAETWPELCRTLVEDVCRDWMSVDDKDQLVQFMTGMKFIPGGRYLYYAGRPLRSWNNCYLLRSEEDTREDWADLSWKAESCLASGGGIGNDYSIYRAEGTPLKRTGGVASGPISKMRMINEIGREVMQGGSRRSAIYASLNANHPDIHKFLVAKDWHHMVIPGTNVSLAEAKQKNFNWPAPLDMTNVSVNYSTDWLVRYRRTSEVGDVFLKNCAQALMTGEPGFSFNFFRHENETLRNAPVSKDTWILTDNGYRQISEIVDRPVNVWTGKQFAHTVFRKTSDDADIIVVEMTGSRTIKAEPTHEFLVERWEGKGSRRELISIDRVPASRLMEGDILHVSMPCPNYGGWRFERSYYTLGFCYGDAHIKGDGTADLSLCTDEKKACFSYMDPGMMTRFNSNDARGYHRIYLRHQLLEDRNKSEYPRLTTSQARSFLAGLFDADGSWCKEQHRIRLSSVSKTFLEGARRDLERLGILSAINRGSVCGYSGNDSWMLVVMADYVSHFKNLIPTHRLKPTEHSSYRASKIRVERLSRGASEDVYCCDVGVPEHSFMAEGVIISNCTEVTSEDDSDVCNLGSVNMSRIDSTQEMAEVVHLASQFLLCGTLGADLPYEKVYKVREKNRRLGLGLMGVHEWLIQRRYRYEVTPELKKWLGIYMHVSVAAANQLADKLGISQPVAYRAIAPTGTIGILAGTTTGIEPVFAVAYKRRYLTNGTTWKYQYVVDAAADDLIQRYGVDPDSIESALDLAADWERRIKFQADVQDYVDMSISSTINLPAWGTELNNEGRVKDFAKTLAKYAHRLRGFTCYPDGSRGGQPLTRVSYNEAVGQLGVEFEEHDVCDITGKGGTCGG